MTTTISITIQGDMVPDDARAIFADLVTDLRDTPGVTHVAGTLLYPGSSLDADDVGDPDPADSEDDPTVIEELVTEPRED